MNVQKIDAYVAPILNEIYAVLDPWFTKLAEQNDTGRAINLSRFKRELASLVKPWDITVALRFNEQTTHSPMYPALSAYCYQPEAGTALISTFFHFDDEQPGRLLWTPGFWKHLQFRYLAILQHELVHRYQWWHRRKHKTPQTYQTFTNLDRLQQKEQEYLGNYDEIEAYALDAVMDWRYYVPHIPLTTRNIHEQFALNSMPALTFFHCEFNGDMNHPAIRALFRKMKHWNKHKKSSLAEHFTCSAVMRDEMRKRLRDMCEEIEEDRS